MAAAAAAQDADAAPKFDLAAAAEPGDAGLLPPPSEEAEQLSNPPEQPDAAEPETAADADADTDAAPDTGRRLLAGGRGCRAVALRAVGPLLFGSGVPAVAPAPLPPTPPSVAPHPPHHPHPHAAAAEYRACRYEVTATRAGLAAVARGAVGKALTYTQGSSRWSFKSSWTCPARVPPAADCSSFVTWIYWTAFGLGPDHLNGQGWAAGYTGSMLYPRGVQVRWRAGLGGGGVAVGPAGAHGPARWPLLCSVLASPPSPAWLSAAAPHHLTQPPSLPPLPAPAQVSRSTYDASGRMLTRASTAAAQLGDLVFYGRGTHSHVGMYVGGGQIVHFGSNNMGSYGVPRLSAVNYRSDIDEVRSYPAFFA